MKWFSLKSLSVLIPVVFAASALAFAADTPPAFNEVFELLKANLVGANASKLEQAALEGMLKQLAPHAVIVTNGQPLAKADGPRVARTVVYDQTYGYLRLGAVEAGLLKELNAAMETLAASNKIQGWILDLRFADGGDYKAATEVADRFVATEQPLLDWGAGMMRSKSKDSLAKAPIMVLVNRETSSAAEALAAMLRKTEAALLIGTNTAGRAFIAKDIPLKTGQRLRVATALVKLGDGSPLSLEGVKPDIRVTVSSRDEKAYLDDAYRNPALAGLGSKGAGSDTNLASAATNRTPRRLNEADLVRMMRDGEDPDDDKPSRSLEPAKPVVKDPALARALDLLKGLAVMKRLK